MIINFLTKKEKITDFLFEVSYDKETLTIEIPDICRAEDIVCLLVSLSNTESRQTYYINTGENDRVTLSLQDIDFIKIKYFNLISNKYLVISNNDLKNN